MPCEQDSVVLITQGSNGWRITYNDTASDPEENKFCYDVAPVGNPQNLSHFTIGIDDTLCPGLIPSLDDSDLACTRDDGGPVTCEVSRGNQPGEIEGVMFTDIELSRTDPDLPITFCVTITTDQPLFLGCVNVTGQAGTSGRVTGGNQIPGPSCTPTPTTTTTTTSTSTSTTTSTSTSTSTTTTSTSTSTTTTSTSTSTTTTSTSTSTTTTSTSTSTTTTSTSTSTTTTSTSTSTTTTSTSTSTTTSSTSTSSTTTVCPIPNPQTCCQHVIEFNTQIVQPSAGIESLRTNVFFSQSPVVEDVCPEKVIICGKLTKVIEYIGLNSEGIVSPNTIETEESFQCVIDREDANQGDIFEVVGYDILCEGKPSLHNKGTRVVNSTTTDVFWRLTEKDIIKVCIRKKEN